uniref:Putative capsid protein n=1 Tax=viral metagenome TaxID=1070528 RepID=A0A6M3J1C5_9ZZZZ
MGWLGLKDVESIGDDAQRPYSWRGGLLMEYPNGDMPLTGLTALMTSREIVEDPQFYWWEKEFQDRSATVTAQHTLPSLLAASAYAGSGAAADILYLKMSSADVQHFRVRHQVAMRYTNDYRVEVRGKVISREDNGASSYIGVKLLEADDNSPDNSLVQCDNVIVIGNINPEFSEFPEGVKYHPSKVYNLTQIFIEPLGASRTALRTTYRTGDMYTEDKREAALYHGIDIEQALTWGIMTDGTGDNGHPERTTRGVVDFIKTYAPDNVDDYSLNADYMGKTWLEGGMDWLNEWLEIITRHGDEKLVICGGQVILGLNRLAMEYGTIQLTPTTTEFGMRVKAWESPFGTFYFKVHPLFRSQTTLNGMALFLEPKHFVYRYIDDTFYCTDPNYLKAKAANAKGGFAFKDGIQEGFITECGLEFHFAKRHGILYGFNQDNRVV